MEICAALGRLGHNIGMQSSTSSRRNKICGALVSVAMVGALLFMILPRLGSIMNDLTKISPIAIGATVLMGIVALLLRGEVWRIALHATTGHQADRHELHAANSFGMLGNSVNHYMGPPVRISLLKRLLPSQTSGAMKMLACDVPVLLIEASVAMLLFAAAVGAAGLPWWLPLAGISVLMLIVGVLWSVRRHQVAKHSFWEAFNVLVSAKSLKRLSFLLFGAIILQFGRTYILLYAVGLHPAFWQVAITFCSTGLLGVLPLGPATSSGATMAIFGAQSATGAAAAGIIMTAAALVSAIVYAAWGVFVLVRHFIRREQQAVPAAVPA